jgi:hypothetical protein
MPTKQAKAFPRVVRTAPKKEQFTAAEQITELRQNLADLEHRVETLQKRVSVLERKRP